MENKILYKDQEIIVKNLISVNDETVFINTTADFVCNSEDGYNPNYYNISYTKCLLTFFTNFQEEITADEISDIIYNTDIIDSISNNISTKQLSHIRHCISQKIEFNKQNIIFEQSKRYNENLALMELTNQQLSEILKNFTPEDIKKITELGNQLSENK